MKARVLNIIVSVFAVILVGVYLIFITEALGFWDWLADWLTRPPKEIAMQIESRFGQGVDLSYKRYNVDNDRRFSLFGNELNDCKYRMDMELGDGYTRTAYICDNEVWIRSKLTYGSSEGPSLYGPFSLK